MISEGKSANRGCGVSIIRLERFERVFRIKICDILSATFRGPDPANSTIALLVRASVTCTRKQPRDEEALLGIENEFLTLEET